MQENTEPRKLPEGYAIEKGTTIIYVRNTQLAACLGAVGIPFRLDPPYTIREKEDGERITTWNFEPQSADGTLNTLELVKVWPEHVKFAEEHPLHPFTFAMIALKNYRQMVDHCINQKPFISYKSMTGEHIVWVIKDSKKDEECKELGLERSSD